MLLYRYLGDKHYLNFARDSVRTVGQSQFEDGSFGDQGGGTGIHGWNQYVVKPWMGCMATGGALDMLDMFPDDPIALKPAKRFADWLMRERHPLSNGIMGWSYQHGYHFGREFMQLNAADPNRIPCPAMASGTSTTSRACSRSIRCAPATRPTSMLGGESRGGLAPYRRQR